MKQFFLAATLFTSTLAFAQQPNAVQFEQGKKIQMKVDVNSSSDLGMGGSLTSKATVYRIFDINSVSDGKAVIEHKIKRVVGSFEAPGAGSQTFDSENEKDLKGPGGKAIEKIIKNKYTMTLDGSGKVAAIKLDDDNAAARGSEDPQTQMITSLLSDVVDGMEIPKVGEATLFSILPARAVTVGESWTDTAGYRSTTYTLVSSNDTEMVIAFREKNKTIRSTAFGPMTINVNLDDATEGRIILDKTTRMLKQKSATTQSTGTMEAMGQETPAKVTVTRAWTVE